jgi:hypothetical protein
MSVDCAWVASRVKGIVRITDTGKIRLIIPRCIQLVKARVTYPTNHSTSNQGDMEAIPIGKDRNEVSESTRDYGQTLCLPK